MNLKGNPAWNCMELRNISIQVQNIVAQRVGLERVLLVFCLVRYGEWSNGNCIIRVTNINGKS